MKLSVFLKLLIFFAVFFLSEYSCGSADALPEYDLVLSLENRDGISLFSIPVRRGDTFAIRYTHSVALTPVIDHFVIKNNGIFLDKTEYQDFGAGLPHNPEGTQIMRTENGRIVICGYDRELPVLQVRVGRIANHCLLLPSKDPESEAPETEREIPLVSLSPPGTAITFAVRGRLDLR